MQAAPDEALSPPPLLTCQDRTSHAGALLSNQCLRRFRFCKEALLLTRQGGVAEVWARSARRSFEDKPLH
jgi:hypothetical protein